MAHVADFNVLISAHSKGKTRVILARDCQTKCSLQVDIRAWRLREPFAVARGVQTEMHVVTVTLTDECGRRGRGESCGISYAGETPASMTAQIENVRFEIELGIDRSELMDLLPAGGARCAVDCALWDLEAKQDCRSPFVAAGIVEPKAVVSAFTIGIRPLAEYESAAAARSEYAMLKIKVDAQDPVAAVEAVRKGAPGAALIVDPNQSWSVPQLKQFAPRLEELGVLLLEQPIKVGDELELDEYSCPIPLCADELVNQPTDLEKAENRFQVVNIKLEKAGGLTAAFALAGAARQAGFQLMVGTMGGSSLAMAPGLVLAQICDFVDLDGPLLQSEDWPNGLCYQGGVVGLPQPALWG